MSLKLPLVLILIGLLSPAVYAQLQVDDTVLFAGVGGRLCQMVHVTGVGDPGGEWRLEVGGKPVRLPVGAVRAHRDGWLVPIPAVDSPTGVKITAGEAGSVTHTVKPQKRWTAYLTPHTHFDCGFTDVQPRVWTQLAGNLHDVLDMCEQTNDWPEEAQYRWTIECSALMEDFIERYPQDVPRLVKLIRGGRIEVAGLYLNLLTELCGGEELCRSLYPIARFRDEYGITVNTAMHNDIPGMTWQMPQLMKSAGIEYLSLRANPVRARFLWDRPEAPTRPFLWEGPDGSSVMMWYTDSYREANFFRDGCPDTAIQDFHAKGNQYDRFLGLIARQEAKGTPVDAIQMRMGGDNITPTINPCRWARAWNERWTYPRIVVGTNRMFFQHIEPFRPQLETHRGDITDWWADGAASFARETGINRAGHERAAMAETLGAVLGVESAVDTWELYRDMLLYDEHTWGASRGLRASDPANGAEQWRIKASYAYRADRSSRKLMKKAWDALADAARSDEAARLIIWNPSSWARSGVVEVELPDGHAVYDVESGRPLQAQPVGDRWAVGVEDVPALGWKAYDVKPGAFAAGSRTCASDPDVPITYIYETGATRDKIRPYPNPPKYDKQWSKARTAYASSLSGRDAALFSKHIAVLASPAGARSAHITVTSYPSLGREDITFRVDKIATEDVEGVYLEFPFDLRRPSVHAGIPFGWMNVETDRLPCTCTDFFSVDRAVDLNDGRRGVTLAAVESPLFEFGRITTDAWSDDLDIRKATVYSYVMNNYWFTNYKFSQGGPHEFRYAIRRYEGEFDPLAASRFGEEVARPLQARMVKPGQAGKWAGIASWSPIRIQPDNVIVTAAKPAEDGRGIILRLAESAGRGAEVHLAASGLGVASLCRCTVLEDDIEELKLSDRVATFSLRPWQIAAVRVIPAGA